MIIEYKLIIENGKITIPPWAKNPGYFYNPKDFTYIGTAPNDNVRRYYLPDTVVTLTRQQLIDRQVLINNENPSDPVKTLEEITAAVNEWCDYVGE
jgi:hypothetical protein